MCVCVTIYYLDIFEADLVTVSAKLVGCLCSFVTEVSPARNSIRLLFSPSYKSTLLLLLSSIFPRLIFGIISRITLLVTQIFLIPGSFFFLET